MVGSALTERERRASVSSGSGSLREDANAADQNRKKGMVLPFEPHSITFDNIKYSVDMPPVRL